MDAMYWKVDTEDLRFEAHMTVSDVGEIGVGAVAGRVPWQPGLDLSTAGAPANMPLPIRWHGHSVDSVCEFSLKIRDASDSTSEKGDGPQVNDCAGLLLRPIWRSTCAHREEMGTAIPSFVHLDPSEGSQVPPRRH